MARYRALYKDGKVVYEEKDGVVIKDERDHGNAPGFYVMGDIQPYRSMIDGSIIESRSKHKAHLKQHKCIEVGNETNYRPPPDRTAEKRRKEQIARAVYQKFR